MERVPSDGLTPEGTGSDTFPFSSSGTEDPDDPPICPFGAFSRTSPGRTPTLDRVLRTLLHRVKRVFIRHSLRPLRAFRVSGPYNPSPVPQYTAPTTLGPDDDQERTIDYRYHYPPFQVYRTDPSSGTPPARTRSPPPRVGVSLLERTFLSTGVYLAPRGTGLLPSFRLRGVPARGPRVSGRGPNRGRDDLPNMTCHLLLTFIATCVPNKNDHLQYQEEEEILVHNPHPTPV